MTAPGWYPDPDDPRARRYYDGANWSGALRDGTPAASAAPDESVHAAGRPPSEVTSRPSRRRLWLSLAAVGAIVVAAAIVLPLTLLGNDSHSSPQIPFGTDPVRVAAQLNICPHAVKSGSVAQCPFDDGLIGVGSIGNQAQQDAAGPALASTKLCALVGHGYQIAAPTHAVLLAHVNVADIQKKYGGALYGAC